MESIVTVAPQLSQSFYEPHIQHPSLADGHGVTTRLPRDQSSCCQAGCTRLLYFFPQLSLASLRILQMVTKSTRSLNRPCRRLESQGTKRMSLMGVMRG